MGCVILVIFADSGFDSPEAAFQAAALEGDMRQAFECATTESQDMMAAGLMPRNDPRLKKLKR